MFGSEKGSVLVIVIVGITIMAAIGAGVSSLVGSGARSGADHSLSVQAYYAAETGLDFARFKLREIHDAGGDWETYCGSQLIADGSDVAIGGNSSFSIDGAVPSGSPPDVCEVTVTGWIGSDKNNSLAKREIPGQSQGKISKDLIEGGDPLPPSPPALPGPEDTAYYAVSSDEKPVTLSFKASVDGHVYGKDVVLSSQADVTGDVIAKEDVTLEFKSSVAGDICASGDVTLASQVNVGGDIHAHEDVTVGWKSEIAGDIFAGGNVTLDSDARVMGSIHSDKSVTVGWNSVVEGDIFAKGEVILEGNAKVMGTVFAKNTVTLGSKDTVSGDVITEGNIDLTAGDNLIEGNAVASGTIELGWKSKIKGTQSEANPDPGVKPPLPPQQCPGLKAPELSEFSAGPVDYSFGWKEDGIIVAPLEDEKKYRNLSADGKNKIYFKGNSEGSCEFRFNSLSFAWDLDLVLDLSQCVDDDGDPADMTFFSEGDIKFGGKMNIYIITEDGETRKMEDVDPEIAKRIYWETHGDFFQGSSSDWFGTVLAQNNIWFDSDNMRFIGAAASVKGTVIMGHSADMTYMPANYAVENW
jgi:predicted acyltransferase (DUF342 family)